MSEIALRIPDIAAAAIFAEYLADHLRGGDVLALCGDLGAGKTAFARWMIRHLTQPDMIVPSPTFTIMQEYDMPQTSHSRHDIALIRHYDLYRLGDDSELMEIGWDDVGGQGIVTLVEWPERAGWRLEGRGLWLFLHQDNPDMPEARNIRLRGDQHWDSRLKIISGWRA